MTIEASFLLQFLKVLYDSYIPNFPILARQNAHQRMRLLLFPTLFAIFMHRRKHPSLTTNIKEKADLIWPIADKLTGILPHEHTEVLPPFTVIRRFGAGTLAVGDEILFTCYFYEYTPPRPSKDIIQESLAIESGLDGVGKEIFHDTK